MASLSIEEAFRMTSSKVLGVWFMSMDKYTKDNSRMENMRVLVSILGRIILNMWVVL